MVELKNWRGDEVQRLAQMRFAQRLEAAAILLQNAIKRDISDPSNHGVTPSEPGQPPHKDTGRLRASISRSVDAANLKARVGTNVLYGKFLELGTRTMAARPFIRKAFYEHFAKIKAILGGK